MCSRVSPALWQNGHAVEQRGAVRDVRPGGTHVRGDNLRRDRAPALIGERRFRLDDVSAVRDGGPDDLDGFTIQRSNREHFEHGTRIGGVGAGWYSARSD